MDELNTNESENNNTQNTNDQHSVGNLLKLIKELADIQASNAIITARIFAREGKEQIADKTNQMKNKVMEQAKSYGKKAEDLANTYTNNKEEKGNILQEYQESLEDIQEEYEARMDSIVEEKVKWQDEEQATMLKEKELKEDRKQIKKTPEYAEQVKQEKALTKEIKQALDEGDLNTVATKNEELKKLKEQNPLLKCDKEIEEVQQSRQEILDVINMCDKEIEECREDRDNSIDEVTADRDNKLAVMKKQNVFQKMAGAILNKMNGVKRFKDNIVAKVEKKIENIRTETIPAIKETVSSKKQQFAENMQEKKTAILDKGRETKEQLMQKAENKLRASIEKGKQIKEQRSVDYSDAQK